MIESTATAKLNRIARFLPLAGGFGLEKYFEESFSRKNGQLHKTIRVKTPSQTRQSKMDGTSVLRAKQHLMGMEEASAMLGVTKNTLYAWVSMRKIPFIKVGRLVKFDQKDIDSWIEERKIRAIAYE